MVPNGTKWYWIVPNCALWYRMMKLYVSCHFICDVHIDCYFYKNHSRYDLLEIGSLNMINSKLLIRMSTILQGILQRNCYKWYLSVQSTKKKCSNSFKIIKNVLKLATYYSLNTCSKIVPSRSCCTSRNFYDLWEWYC